MKKLINLFVIILLLSACTETDYTDLRNTEASQKTSLTENELLVIKIANEGTLISKDEALQNAVAFFNKANTKSLDEKNCKILWIKRTNTQNSISCSKAAEPDSIPIYLISQPNNGAILISGDKRLAEILAFSENNLSIEKTGTGADIFLEALPFYVNEKINEFNAKYDSLLLVAQEKIRILNNSTETKSSPTVFQRIETEYTNWTDVYSYGPLISVKWGQFDPENTALNKINCNGVIVYPPAGCTTIAVAQLLSYHKFPSTINNSFINWNEVTKVSSAASLALIYQIQLANLIKNIGAGVFTKYDCKGSGSNINDAHSFIRQQGYQSDNITGYNFSNILSSIQNNRPVYTRGSSRQSDASYVGHAWVIDGAKKQQRTITHKTYSFIGSGTPHNPVIQSEWNLIDTESAKEYAEFVYCNYGWYGSHNGYYRSGVFKIENIGYDFNTNLQIITNIRH